MIEVKHLSKDFGKKNEIKVLRDISETIDKGEKVVIIGPSGSGKSTFLRCLNLLEQPTSGQIFFDGEEITDRRCNINRVRMKMGMVFQHFNLFPHKTILQNISMVPIKLKLMKNEEAQENALQLLRRVGLPDKADAYPGQLSGGQKQRIAIARALATDPKVLLCDEATSALDPNTTHSILQLIQKINQELGITVVIITHQMSVVEEVCNHVAILDGGRVVEQGDVSEIFSNPRTDAARRLVFPAGAPRSEGELLPGRRLVRVAFNGTQTTDKPLVASLAIECGALVSIVAADTRLVHGQTLGSMLLALPEDEAAAQRAIDYIRAYPGLSFEEVEHA